jgi:hypothetical protein
MLLKSGIPAPNFELPDETGATHRLSDYRNKTVLLYFYPKDDTPATSGMIIRRTRKHLSSFWALAPILLNHMPNSRLSSTCHSRYWLMRGMRCANNMVCGG